MADVNIWCASVPIRYPFPATRAGVMAAAAHLRGKMPPNAAV